MRKKILIIEDTNILAQSIADWLYMEGYHVRICSNGLQALNSLVEFPPDLILTDLIMPEMDGLEFVRHFRKQNAPGSTPIIILTADTNEENNHKAASAGADLLLHKPFNPDILISQIKKLING